jgi:integrase
MRSPLLMLAVILFPAWVQLMRRMGVRATPHGFRSCFKDWASESTSYARGVVEISLAHSVGSAVEQVYARSDLLAKRAQPMAAWASYCAQSPATSRERVTAIREAAHGH